MNKPTNQEMVDSLKKKISLLEWDVQLIKDETLLKKKQANLDTLRSELKRVMLQPENN